MEEEKTKYNLKQPVFEDLNVEMQPKLIGLMDKNKSSLNLEQGEY